MKKFFVSILIAFTLLAFADATSIDMQSSLHLEQNEGIVDLPVITIDLDESITGFSLNIKDRDFMIFQPQENLDFSDDFKTVYFQGYFTGQLEITGLQIRTYYEDIRSAKLGLDLDLDGVVEEETTKYIELDDDDKNDDRMEPLAVGDLDYIVEVDGVLLTWTKSPDLDIMKQIVRVVRDDGSRLDHFLSSNTDSYKLENLDLENHSYTIEVYAKDIYYAGDIAEIEIPQNTELIDEDENTNTGVNTSGVVEQLPEIYLPQSDLVKLVDLAQRFDVFIQNRLDFIDADFEKQKMARTARNEAIKLLEDMQLGNIASELFSEKLKEVVQKLVSALE